MKKLLICLVAATVYLNPIYPVYAIDGKAVDTIKPASLKDKMEIENERMGSKEAELKNRMDDRKEKVASVVGNLKDKWASKEAALKERLAKFKDKNKANLTEKINSTLQTINTNRTKVMKSNLERLSKILDAIETRVNEAGTNGKNTDSAKSAISSARTAIKNAQVAVDAQADKDYIISITSETTVKEDAKMMRDKLLEDLKSTQDLVKQARQSVEEAFKAAKEVLGASVSPAASV